MHRVTNLKDYCFTVEYILCLLFKFKKKAKLGSIAFIITVKVENFD